LHVGTSAAARRASYLAKEYFSQKRAVQRIISTTGKCFSAQKMIDRERVNQKRNEKYIEALRANVSSQIGMKGYFQRVITGICG